MINTLNFNINTTHIELVFFNTIISFFIKFVSYQVGFYSNLDVVFNQNH